jgi:ribosomal protein S18 acetylase RimI-like enzyme
VIRPAQVADAAALAAIQVDGWHWAYRGIMPDDVLERLSVEDRRARWHDILADGRGTTVAEADGVIVGFSSWGPIRDEDAAGAGEVYALYVDRHAARQGHGRCLLTAALDALEADGFHDVRLWVLRDNTPARLFYEALGWTPDGIEKASPWGPMEVRYRAP